MRLNERAGKIGLVGSPRERYCLWSEGGSRLLAMGLPGAVHGFNRLGARGGARQDREDPGVVRRPQQLASGLPQEAQRHPGISNPHIS